MKKLPWYLNVLLWIFAICGGFFLILFIRACLLAVGILKKDTDSTAKTASNLFGLLNTNSNDGDDTPTKYYKLNQDYTFYGKDDLKTILTFKKDAVIRGFIVQLDANSMGNPDLPHIMSIDIKDFIKIYPNKNDAAIPLSLLTLLTKEEYDKWYSTQPVP